MNERLFDVAQYFYYDETSKSCLKWKVPMFCGIGHTRVLVNSGDDAGTIAKSGYWTTCVSGVDVRISRVVYLLTQGEIPEGMHVDHVDGDRLNNNMANLRCVTNTENQRNLKKMKSNTSGKTGVSFVKRQNLWRAVWKCHLTKKEKKKAFSVNKYGEKAFHMACEYRDLMISKMNEDGAGYTERHGL